MNINPQRWYSCLYTDEVRVKRVFIFDSCGVHESWQQNIGQYYNARVATEGEQRERYENVANSARSRE